MKLNSAVWAKSSLARIYSPLFDQPADSLTAWSSGLYEVVFGVILFTGGRGEEIRNRLRQTSIHLQSKHSLYPTNLDDEVILTFLRQHRC